MKKTVLGSWYSRLSPEEKKEHNRKTYAAFLKRKAESPEKIKEQQRRANAKAIAKRGTAAASERWKVWAYGVDEAAYQQMLAEQGGCCAICGSAEPSRKRDTKFCIDHCHTSGKVRGLLCVGCNADLGQFKDNPQRLRSAAVYLENNSG